MVAHTFTPSTSDQVDFGQNVLYRNPRSGTDGDKNHHPPLGKDLCGAVHRAGDPRPEEGHGALLPHLWAVRCSAGLQGPAHPAVSENPAARDSQIYRHRAG